MYFVAPGKLSSGTRPPCFWNWGTAAGLVLKTRHGALPAVIAAPITSSEVLPAGISCADTFWSECASFHSFTIALPQAISSGLLESQTLIGPVELSALPESPPLPQAAVTPRARTASEVVTRWRFMVLLSARCWSGRRAHDQACGGQIGGRWLLQVDQLEEPGGGRTSPGHDVGVHRGQGRLEVCRDLDVVEPGDRQVTRHRDAACEGQRESGHGHQVVGEDDGGRRHRLVEQHAHRAGARLGREVRLDAG